MMGYIRIVLFMCALSTSAQFAIGKQLPVVGKYDPIDNVEMLLSDDQDFNVELLNELGYASGDENIQPTSILNEISSGYSSGYREYDDNERERFLVPKSILAMLYEGSSKLEKSSTTEYDGGWNRETSVEETSASEIYQVSFSNEDGTGIGKTTTTYVENETSSQLPTATIAEELETRRELMEITAHSDSTGSTTLPLTTRFASVEQTTQVHDYNESGSTSGSEQSGEFFFEDVTTSDPRKESTEAHNYEEGTTRNPSNENGNYLPLYEPGYINNLAQPSVYSSQGHQNDSGININSAIEEDQDELRQK